MKQEATEARGTATSDVSSKQRVTREKEGERETTGARLSRERVSVRERERGNTCTHHRERVKGGANERVSE